MDCIFCQIVSNPSNAHVVHEDDQFIAFLDIFPINEGHTLVIPKKHQEFIWDLDNETYSTIFNVAKIVASKLENAFKPKAVALAVEGLSVPHTHIHLVPVYNVGELNPARARKANPEDLKHVLQKIIS